MRKIKCLVVDDEPIARYGVIKYLKDIEHIELIGQAGDANSAGELMMREKFDLLLMDINLTGKSGIEFYKQLEHAKPMIIFITAYSEFAVESYGLNAVDYLLKPVEKSRFIQAMYKALDQFNGAQHQNTNNSIYVRAGYKYCNLNINEIEYISGMQNYIQVHLRGNRKVTLHMTLKKICEKLSGLNFEFVHKSYIVNCSYIESFIHNQLKIKNSCFVPVGRNYKPHVLEMIKKDCCFQ